MLGEVWVGGGVVVTERLVGADVEREDASGGVVVAGRSAEVLDEKVRGVVVMITAGVVCEFVLVCGAVVLAGTVLVVVADDVVSALLVVSPSLPWPCVHGPPAGPCHP